MLVAACPGGALSNVITHLGRGNLALSLSISAVSNVLALVLTPLNFTLMIGANPDTAAWARSIAVDPKDLVVSLLLLLAIPMSAALLTTHRTPALAARRHRGERHAELRSRVGDHRSAVRLGPCNARGGRAVGHLAHCFRRDARIALARPGQKGAQACLKGMRSFPEFRL